MSGIAAQRARLPDPQRADLPGLDEVTEILHGRHATNGVEAR